MHLSPINPLFLFATLLALTMRVHANLPVRVITHNIRQAVPLPTFGEKPWSDRKQLILNELHYNTLYSPEAFICMQEVLHEQLVDILAGLGDEWAYIGVGRDDGKEKGEYSPVLYRKAVWEPTTWHTVWLNEDGAVGKKGWDAGSVRILTIGTFRHSQSKQVVVGMSTHLDNSGRVARRESAKIILSTIEAITTNYSTTTRSASPPATLPFFLAGDLNSETDGEAYQILNNGTASTQDAKAMAKWTYGDENTFTDFQDNKKRFTLIDFVFLGPRGGEDWEVEGYSVLPNKFEDGVFGSDHRAVVVDGVLRV